MHPRDFSVGMGRVDEVVAALRARSYARLEPLLQYVPRPCVDSNVESNRFAPYCPPGIDPGPGIASIRFSQCEAVTVTELFLRQYVEKLPRGLFLYGVLRTPDGLLVMLGRSPQDGGPVFATMDSGAKAIVQLGNGCGSYNLPGDPDWVVPPPGDTPPHLGSALSASPLRGGLALIDKEC
jgi:hypothetical protein